MGNSIYDQVKRAVWCCALMKGGPVYLYGYMDKYELRKKGSKITDTKLLLDFQLADSDSYWEYYGGSPKFNRELAEQLIVSLKASGINWEAMPELEDDIKDEFNGSYGENRSIPVMKGFLHTNDGKVYPWMANLELPMTNLMTILRYVKEWETKTDDELVADLLDRLRKAVRYKSSFHL